MWAPAATIVNTYLILVVDEHSQPGLGSTAAYCNGDLVAHGTIVGALDNAINLRLGVCDLVLLALARSVTKDANEDSLVLRTRSEADSWSS
jgi:hypothetical protein